MDCRSDNIWIPIGGKPFNGLSDSSHHGNPPSYAGSGQVWCISTIDAGINSWLHWCHIQNIESRFKILCDILNLGTKFHSKIYLMWFVIFVVWVRHYFSYTEYKVLDSCPNTPVKDVAIILH